MPKLILKVRPREAHEVAKETATTEEGKMEPQNTSMFNDDGSMRMMPGWTQVERHNDVIGRNMPYARKGTKVAVEDEDANLLRSEKSKESKQVLLLMNELPSSTGTEPLPLLTPDLIREIIRQDGTVRRNLNFKPFPIYRLEENNGPRIAAPNPEREGLKQEYALEILYPLFKVEKIERVDRRQVKASSEHAADSTTRKVKRGDDWEYGPWSLNDDQAGMWEAAHPDVKLSRFGDGRWSHPDFYERVYVTSLGTRYPESLIARKDDLGLFEYDGAEYVWKLNPHCQDIELYEAHMDKKIRRYWQRKQEEKDEGEGPGNWSGEMEPEMS